MINRRFLLLTSVCVATFLGGRIDEARAETLADAVRAAVTDHPSVTAAQANRDALGEDEKEKRSNYFPQLSAEASAGRIYGDNATSRGLSVTRGAGYSGYGSGSVNLSERIFDGFETNNRVNAARDRKDSADYSIADVQEDLALRATLAYLDVLRGQDSVAQLEKYGKTINGYIGRIEKAVKEGGVDASLREQARDIKAQLDNTLSSSRGQLQTAIATYVEIVGHAPTQPMEKPPAPLGILPDTPDEAVAYAFDHQPALKAASLTEHAAQMDSEAERAAYYPALNGQLSYLKSDEKDLLGGELTDARALLKLDWNYATGGAEQARVRKALHQSAQSRAQKMDLQRQIERRIQIAYSDRATSEEQLQIQQHRVTLNAGLFKTQKQQFEGGKVNLLQLLQSDNGLFNARLGLVNDEYKLLGAHYSVLASIGRLQNMLQDPAYTAPMAMPHSSAAAPDTAEKILHLTVDAATAAPSAAVPKTAKKIKTKTTIKKTETRTDDGTTVAKTETVETETVKTDSVAIEPVKAESLDASPAKAQTMSRAAPAPSPSATSGAMPSTETLLGPGPQQFSPPPPSLSSTAAPAPAVAPVAGPVSTPVSQTTPASESLLGPSGPIQAQPGQATTPALAPVPSPTPQTTMPEAASLPPMTPVTPKKPDVAPVAPLNPEKTFESPAPATTPSDRLNGSE